MLRASFRKCAGLKEFAHIPAGTTGVFDKVGVSGQLAVPTILAEAMGGAALILGAGTCQVDLAAIPILLGAIANVHGFTGFSFNNP